MKSERIASGEMTDLTICIPVRIDSVYRKRNLESILIFFSENMNCSILIVEADQQSLAGDILFNENCQYIFIEDNDPVFHRTKYINIMFGLISTPFAAVWDCDVVAYPDQVYAACELLRTQKLTLVYPYIGDFIYVESYYSEIFHCSRDLQLLDSTYFSKRLFHGSGAVGGAYLVNVEKYLLIGGENENFYGWGPEDAEREKRVEIIEAGIARVEGGLFHLDHSRGKGSDYFSQEIQLRSMEEFCNICSMTKNELSDYINKILIPR